MVRKIVDWNNALLHIIPGYKKPISETLHRHDELKRLVFEASESKKKLSIDWSFYKKNSRSLDSMWIDECKKRLMEFSPVPMNSYDTISAVDLEEEALVILL